jgi:CRP-like cAMP-binding protein
MPDQHDLRRNAILAALPDAEFAPLRDLLEMVEPRMRQQVSEPGQPISDVYFPLASVFSMVGTTDGRAQVEVATIGFEGMAGLPVFLGAAASPHATFCQIPGPAARLSAGGLRASLNQDGALHAMLSRFTQATMVQIAQNVVCNNTHDTRQRACRWLLTTHDRIGRDEFLLTQEFLAQMLGVHRPTVSQVASQLQSDGLIRYSRGVITILGRHGLEQAACQCYAIVRAEFDAMTHRR